MKKEGLWWKNSLFLFGVHGGFFVKFDTIFLILMCVQLIWVQFLTSHLPMQKSVKSCVQHRISISASDKVVF